MRKSSSLLLVSCVALATRTQSEVLPIQKRPRRDKRHPSQQEQQRAERELDPAPKEKDEAFRVHMGFIDVDSSPEAIQEDEDLIEAVEQFVGGAAHTVYQDIMDDVNAFLGRTYGAITSAFPFLAYWKEDTSYFWSDMEKVGIFMALFLVAFFVLAPSQRRRKKKSGSWNSWHSTDYENAFGDGKHRAMLGKAAKPFAFKRSHSSSSPAMVALASRRFERRNKHLPRHESDEESPEEKFAKRWSTLSNSKYRRLVLPPECKRVEKPHHHHLHRKKDEKKRRRSSAKTQKEEELDEEHPLYRLREYYSQCKHLAITFIKFDYIGFFHTLTHVFQACFKNRRNPPNPNEFEDDDESIASSVKHGSVASQSSTVASTSGGTRGSLRSDIASKRNSYAKDQDDDDASIASSVSANSAASTSSRRVSGTQQQPEPVAAQTPKLSNEGGSKKTFSMNDGAGKRVSIDDRAPSMPVMNSSSMEGKKTKDALNNYRTAPSRAYASMPSDVRDTDDLLENMADSPADNATINHDTRHSIAANFFDSAESQEHLTTMVLDAPMPDEHGYVLGDEYLPDNNFTPLLVFVNSRSGQKQGDLLVTQLRGLLNPVQVWDLADGGPEDVLESFLVFSRLRLLVCGGDGTVSWIVGAIEKMNLQKWPPLAILPLGTGNDLARVHGWGGGYTNESLNGILQDVTESYVSWLDRWEIVEENKKGKVKSVKEFLNYFGVGVDAQSALQVHMLRESRPQLFFSRVVNKVWYALFGAEEIIKATSVHLPYEVTLIADGVEVPLPSDSQGIIFLNIDSYAGGVPIWSTAEKDENSEAQPYEPSRRSRFRRSKSMDEITGSKRSRSHSMDRIDSAEDISSMALTKDEKYQKVTACERPSSCQDGLLDVVSIRGAFHLGQIQVGMGSALKLCQCRSAEITLKRKMAVQLDGEPWRQDVSVLKVKRKEDAAIMLHRTSDDSNGVESEMTKLLDWAEDENLIDNEIHAALMKEFSRRIERKTRQKKGKSSQDNLMFALKRAMAPSEDTEEDADSASPSRNIMF